MKNAFKITKQFTGGILKDLTHTSLSSIYLPVGHAVPKPIGGSPYVITACEAVTVSNSQATGFDNGGE